MKLKINETLVLNSVELPKNLSNVEAPINHVFAIDCSGSMSYDLPKIRKQLKNKLPALLKPSDTISLIWFSGKSEFGKLVEKLEVKSATSLDNLNKAIDRWLNPIGLTGFVEPLQTAKDIIKDDALYSFYFLTDGFDNQWSASEILSICDTIKADTSVIIEYGWNCNRALLNQMAEALNGSVIFAEDFEKYDPIFDSILTHQTTKKIVVDVPDAINSYAFSMSELGAVGYTVIDNCVYVPQNVDTVYYYTRETILSKKNLIQEAKEKLSPIYQSLGLFAAKKNSAFVKELLFALGDVKLFNQYSNCFGKQNLTDFCKATTECSKIENMYSEGVDFELKADPNAFTIIDLLFILSNDKGNLISLDDLKYNRISIGTETAVDIEKEKEVLLEALKTAKFEDLSSIMEQLKALQEKQPATFTKHKVKGYPISNLNWHENRANVSMLVKIDGDVVLPKNEYNLEKVESFIFRNYTVIRDGIANIDILPVYLSKHTFNSLKKLKMVSGQYEDKVYFLNIRNLPTINENMVRNVKAEDFFKLIYQEMKLKASEKVYKAFSEKWFGKVVNEGLLEKYGEAVSEYLKNLGVTDRGYSPKVTTKESTDFYISTELHASIKGFSTIPSYNAFMKKIDAKKPLTPSESLLKEQYDIFMVYENQNTDEYTKRTVLGKCHEYLKRGFEEVQQQLTEMKFSIIVGQTWFSDCENEIKVKVQDMELECKAELRDVQVNI